MLHRSTEFLHFKEGRIPYFLLRDALPFPNEDYDKAVQEWTPKISRDERYWKPIDNLRGDQDLPSGTACSVSLLPSICLSSSLLIISSHHHFLCVFILLSLRFEWSILQPILQWPQTLRAHTSYGYCETSRNSIPSYLRDGIWNFRSFSHNLCWEGQCSGSAYGYY